MSAIYCPKCAAFLIVGFQHFLTPFDCPSCAQKIAPEVPPLPPEHVDMYLRFTRPLGPEQAESA